MLTGSSIIAACFGLGWLVAEISGTAKDVLVALSLSACTGNSICMAIDHVWSNYVLSKSSIEECKEHKTNVIRKRNRSHQNFNIISYKNDESFELIKI